MDSEVCETGFEVDFGKKQSWKLKWNSTRSRKFIYMRNSKCGLKINFTPNISALVNGSQINQRNSFIYVEQERTLSLRDEDVSTAAEFLSALERWV